MAEFAPHHEKLHMPETAGDDHERPVNRVERRAETIGAATKSLEAIRHDIAEQARSKREVQVNKPEQQTTVYPTFVNRSLKLIARRRLLKQIRRHLAPPSPIAGSGTAARGKSHQSGGPSPLSGTTAKKANADNAPDAKPAAVAEADPDTIFIDNDGTLHLRGK